MLASLTLIGAGLRLPNPEATGSVETSILSFQSAADFPGGDITSATLRIVFEGNIEWPNGDESSDFEGVLLVDPPAEAPDASTVRGFKIPAGSNIAIVVDRAEGLVRLELMGPALEFVVIPAADASVAAEGSGCDDDVCSRTAGGQRPIRLRTFDYSSLQIIFDIPESPMDFANQLSVDRLEFWDSQNLDGAIQISSGLQRGTLRFLATPDVHHEFQRGDIVSVVPSRVVMRSVEISATTITAQFSGVVADVRAQIGSSTYSLKPNFLEKLSRVPRVKFGIALITFLLGAGFSLKIRRRQRQAETAP